MNASLKFQLGRVAARQGRGRLWLKLAAVWGGTALAALALSAVQRQTGWTSVLLLPLVALAGATVAVVTLVREGRREPDWIRLARRLEARYPDLDGRLLTAVEQAPGPDGQSSYLQERVVLETLRHSQLRDWTALVPWPRLALAQTAHWLALAALLVTLPSLRAPRGAGWLAHTPPEQGVTVSPGDTSLERGSSLVVLARFPKSVPAAVALVVGQAPTLARTPLVKSLADPLFGGSLPEVTSNLVYHVAYGAERTRDFKVTVFEYPRLERADLQVTSPPYTGLAPKRIENTRRLSAVQGSHLDLGLRLNKPVAAARLLPRGKEAPVLALTVSSNLPTAELAHFQLESSQTYELQLVDGEGRSNKVGAQFVFEVLPNRPPELRLASPRGDQRPSPLEELTFEGTVWDDFGVEAYGLGYAMAGQEPKLLELGRAVPAKEKRAFKHVLRLEELGVQPDELVSWFVWADDRDSQGQVRHNSGDLYFGEVRPFDEVFREGQSMDGAGGGGQGGEQGGQSETAKLTELQKQIISATWKLQREHAVSNRAGLKPRGQTAIPAPRRPRVLARLVEHPAPAGSHAALPAGFYMGQVAPSPRGDSVRTARERLAALNTNTPAIGRAPTYEEDIQVVRTAQDQALEQLRAAQAKVQDPRAAVLVSTAVKELEKASSLLAQAAGSRAKLSESLAAEQSAYQALLRLQEHEYQVARSRNRRQQGGGGRNQPRERQLEELEMTESENRYETQRQAQAPAAARGEQLQAMNRLQELARRQQDLNERLKELQTALQEARTEAERAEIQRRLKRLQEEEQQVLSDVDELRQRLDRPENQSRMAEERRQLEQTRSDVQRAAEAAGQGATSQALAAGTRAQRQLQELREQMRKANSSQFADELRDMRSQARELSRRQDEIARQAEAETRAERKSLSDSPEHQSLLKQVEEQRTQITNLVDRATQLSQQAETAEPLLSRQLYDSVRQYAQESGQDVKELRDQLLSRGLMTRNLYDRLNDAATPEGAKLQELTSEMVRQGFPAPASQAAQRARAPLENFRRGVERAAGSVLGDDTEALRLAQRQLDQLTGQVEREMAQAAGGGTNVTGTNALAGTAAQPGAPGQTNRVSSPGELGTNGVAEVAQAQRAQGRGPDQPGQTPGREERGNDASGQGAPAQSRNEQAGGDSQPTPAESASERSARAGQGGPSRQAQLARNERPNPGSRNGRPSPGQQSGRRSSSPTVGGGEGGDLSGSLSQSLDRLFDEGSLRQDGPVTGDDFMPWSDRLREVEEMIEIPDLRNQVAAARERARQIRQQFKAERQKPDWAVVRLQVVQPLVEVQTRIGEELAQRASREAVTPIDRDPVPNRYSELVRRYYEELGKEK